MKTFAFSPTNTLKQKYENILIKGRNQDFLMDSFKIGILVVVFLFCMVVYLRYVSLSSTHGYFLRQENQNLNNISFQYEIYKTQILDQRQKNREKMIGNNTKKPQVVSVDAQIVTIPVVRELSMTE